MAYINPNSRGLAALATLFLVATLLLTPVKWTADLVSRNR